MGNQRKKCRFGQFPQSGISSQSLSEKPRLVKGYGASLRMAGDKLPNWALPKLYPQQEALINPAGPGAGSEISRSSQPRFQRAVE